MQNRQLASLKRTPINNRKDTPSIPVQGLRAQGRKGKQNAFWRFKIFGTLVITFVVVVYSPLKRMNQVTQCWRRGGVRTTDPQGEVRKSSSMFFCFSSSWHIKPLVGVHLGRELYSNKEAQAFQLSLENKTRKGPSPSITPYEKLRSALKWVSFPVTWKLTKVQQYLQRSFPTPQFSFVHPRINNIFFKKKIKLD